MSVDQDIQFCVSSDGVRIAYTTSGRGPPLVKAANWLTHIEGDWRSPVWRHWLDALSADHMLVRYDERGCGLSDRDVDDMSFDAWVRDMEAVVDALDAERFALLGLSQGGPVAVAYAVRHPDRVSHLVMHGSYSRGRRYQNIDAADLEMEMALLRAGWGQDNQSFRHVFTHRFIPGGTAEQFESFDELQRLSCSAETAVRLRNEFNRIDVRELAPLVQCPVLVTHPRLDRVVPFEEGRLLASLIPGARFVPLDSMNHLLLADEPAWHQFVEEVRSFLGVAEEVEKPDEEPRPLGGLEHPRRQLTTVLFADIVESTRVAAEVGDARWRDLLDSFFQAMAADLEHHGGQELTRAGDGFLATFDQPSGAVKCALTLRHSSNELGLKIRIGIHTGEVEIHPDDISGLGVHVGARISSSAKPNEIWASRTVRDLVVGSDITFHDVGTFQLKGVPDEWQLFVIEEGKT